MTEQTKTLTAKPSKQSKRESHAEATANIASGFVISASVWAYVVNPLIKFEILSLDNWFVITTIFTITSYIRSYVWRRIFNRRIGNDRKY